jgi:hypothetical protein
MREVVESSDVPTIENVDAAGLAHERIAPTRHETIDGLFRPRDDAGLGPRFALVGVAGKDAGIVDRRHENQKE